MAMFPLYRSLMFLHSTHDHKHRLGAAELNQSSGLHFIKQAMWYTLANPGGVADLK